MAVPSATQMPILSLSHLFSGVSIVPAALHASSVSVARRHHLRGWVEGRIQRSLAAWSLQRCFLMNVCSVGDGVIHSGTSPVTLRIGAQGSCC